jgi:hypothetical protein
MNVETKIKIKKTYIKNFYIKFRLTDKSFIFDPQNR